MKKFLSFCVSLSLLAATFTGCSSAAPAATTSAENSSGGISGKITVQFWHCMSGGNGDLTNKLVDDFNKSQNKVKVVATYQGNYSDAAAKAEQAIYAGNGPDILQVAQDNVGRLATNGQFTDLLPYMKKAGINADSFTKAFVQDAYYDGKLVDIPYGRSAQLLHINKTILDQVGAKIPTTWDELKEAAEKCTVQKNGKVIRYGLSIPFDQWELFALIQQAGGQFFNKNKTGLGCLDDGSAKKSFQFLKSMQTSGALYYNDPANDKDNQLFTQGMAAMSINSSGTITSRTKSIGSKFNYIVVPLPKDVKYSMPTGGSGFGILSSSKQKDAAWQFMQWFVQNEKGGTAFVLGSGYLPFTQEMTQSKAIQDLWKKNPNYKVAYDALQYGDDSYRIANLTPVIAEFRTCIQAIMLDNKDIDSSLKTFSDSVNTILAK